LLKHVYVATEQYRQNKEYILNKIIRFQKHCVDPYQQDQWRWLWAERCHQLRRYRQCTRTVDPLALWFQTTSLYSTVVSYWQQTHWKTLHPLWTTL